MSINVYQHKVSKTLEEIKNYLSCYFTEVGVKLTFHKTNIELMVPWEK